MPRPVLQAVIDSLTRGAEYATDDVPRWGYETLDAERTEMAEFLRCRKEELAFTHNCTEAMSIIANGLDLQARRRSPPHQSGTWQRNGLLEAEGCASTALRSVKWKSRYSPSNRKNSRIASSRRLVPRLACLVSAALPAPPV